ncbi:MAG: adenosine kinase, partial [Alphaproteobacteria bacterium]|nr:adenosine kinase [Alphaproteobacteria bacterium]
DFDQAVTAVRADCELAALTCSAKGSVIVDRHDVHRVPAAPAARVVDTTGAGDLYASGFLYGYTRGLPAAACGKIGAIAAAEVISHFGARPETSLKSLIAAAETPA